jgi:hypothetical protein
MPDDRIYDAINLFKYSPTGHGNGRIGGDEEYRRRYHQLAVSVQHKLWALWSANEIGFAHLPSRLIGDSSDRRRGFDIRISVSIEPTTDPARYPTAANQGKVAATSCNVVHEATHLVRGVACRAESEMLCRTLEVCYFRDLESPIGYLSRVTGTPCTAQFLPSTPLYWEYQARIDQIATANLIDAVFELETYRTDLESSATARFIARSLTWWGGPGNRWPETRGYYLRSLASQRDHNYGEQILQILRSLNRATWPDARAYCGSIENVRHRLAADRNFDDREFARSVTLAQDELGENFGIRRGNL